MKKFFSFLTVVLLSLNVAVADVGMDDSKSMSGSFTGDITAIEDARDSITVVNDEGTVRMFEVSAGRKAKLSVGDRVRVGYSDQYEWPIPAKSLEVLSSGMGDK
ncbi:MAG: hypothetical protein SFY92_03480 [Verrucomicrobiae bacterium]|nr:hypothetical protein [Verrucomicrobiae bacterium]